MPADISKRIRTLGRRADITQIRAVIRLLCTWRPLQTAQIATLLGRNQTYVLNEHLRPMVRDDELEYVYPDILAHPRQAYRTRDRHRSNDTTITDP